MSKTENLFDPEEWSDEQVDALLERLEERVDTDSELGQAIVSRRRDVLKAIGAVGTGGALGAVGMNAVSRDATAADTSAGQLGTAGNSHDLVLDQLKDPGGDVVADLDDTGDINWQGRGFDNLASIETDKLNSVRYAKTPDDLAAELANLPSHGGYVKLQPGEYTDSDISTRIDIPANADSHYILDLSGSTFTFSSFTPTTAYIHRDNPNNNRPQPITIIGPDKWDVSSVSNPPAAVYVEDLTMAEVRLHNLIGPFDWSIDYEQQNGSGHYNRFYAEGKDLVSGYRIVGNGVSNDRSFFFGQFSRLENFGLKADNARWNEFYTQVENEKSGNSVTGYRLLPNCSNNTVWKSEEGPTVPFFIEGEGNEIKFNFPPAGRTHVLDSKVATKPTNWRNPYWDSFALDKASGATGYDTAGDGSVSTDNFGSVVIKAGTTDGNVQPLQAQTRPGAISDGVTAYSVLTLQTTGNQIIRQGVWVDSNNYAMLVADSSNTNWRAKVLDGGNVAANVDTGVGIDTSLTKAQVMAATNSQQFFLNTSHVAEASVDISSWGANARPRTAVEVSGSPGSNRKITLNNFEYMGQS